MNNNIEDRKEYGDTVLEHIRRTRGIQNILRYSPRQKIVKREVASHSWSVAKIAGLLGEIEIGFGNDVDLAKIYKMAINHDIAEAYMGDIPSPTKELMVGLKDTLDQLEAKVESEILGQTLPNELKDNFLESTLECRTGQTLEARIVKCADLIDRLFECLEDIELGNTGGLYESIMNRDIIKVLNEDIHSVKYLMCEILDIPMCRSIIEKDTIKRLEDLKFDMDVDLLLN